MPPKGKESAADDAKPAAAAAKEQAKALLASCDRALQAASNGNLAKAKSALAALKEDSSVVFSAKAFLHFVHLESAKPGDTIRVLRDAVEAERNAVSLSPACLLSHFMLVHAQMLLSTELLKLQADEAENWENTVKAMARYALASCKASTVQLADMLVLEKKMFGLDARGSTVADSVLTQDLKKYLLKCDAVRALTP